MALVVDPHSDVAHGPWPYPNTQGGKRVAFVRDGVLARLAEVAPAARMGPVTDAELLARRPAEYWGAPVETSVELSARVAIEAADATAVSDRSAARALLRAAVIAIRAKPAGTRIDAERAVLALAQILREDS